MNDLTRRRWSRRCLLVGALSFTGSLFVPCYYTGGYENNVPTLAPTYGIEALLLGWVELPEFGYSAWLANPLALIAWTLLLAPTRAPSMIAAIMALAVSLSFLSYDTVLVNEAGHAAEVMRYGTGYWLWILSFIWFCIATTIAPRTARSSSDE